MKNEVYYAFTVKVVTRVKPLKEHYEDWVLKAKEKGFNVIQYFYEIDSLDRLHIHGVATAKTSYYAPRLAPKGIHTLIVPIDSHNDLVKWSDYIQKEQTEPYLQKLVAYDIRHQYSFIN